LTGFAELARKVRLQPSFLWEMLAGHTLSPNEFISSISDVQNLDWSISREARFVAACGDACLQKPTQLQKASVEQIWSSWRYEKQAPKSANAAERVNQLKRTGEYETALQVALAEVKLEEQGGPPDWRAGDGPLVLLGSGHDLSEAQAIR
jgi:hypothetical protein